MKEQATRRLAILIDTRKCFDCKACMVACKVENNIPDGRWRNWVKDDGEGFSPRTQYQPGQCMQCDRPTCVAACPVGATYKGRDGIVVIRPQACIGCGNCVTACPYDARYRHPVTGLADKCDFCGHRLKRGETPACVETCPTKARIFGDLNDPESEIARAMKIIKPVQVIARQIDTLPNIFYVEGTTLLTWPNAPRLPGNMNMPDSFWRQG
jgi:Fe-S-cluster-containing dehydrogenase component